MNRFFGQLHVYALFVSLCFIGGTTWAFQKIGLTNSLPLWSAGMRFTIAGLLISILLSTQKKYVISKELIKLSILNGLMYFAIPFGTVYWAGQYLSSGLISILAASISIFLLLLNKLFKGIPTTKAQKIGVLLSIIGMIVVFGNQLSIKASLIEGTAMSFVILAMFGSAFITIQVQQRIQDIPILTFNSFSMLSGGFVLLLSSLFLEHGNRTFSGISLVALLYLAIVGSVLGLWINMYLLKSWHISRATMHLFVSPVLALYVGFVFLGELLSQNIYIGTVFILTGVFLINRKKQEGGSSHVQKQTSGYHMSK
ncbi:EamA family transporter [Ectobacillus funiculus]|uniref:DMT family transporter n=1 Tax=Ectobacillus funiculus TaxID=137993 RepID=UPI003979C480